MKNIGIFCDGTWQHMGQLDDTNVALLARVVTPSATVNGEEIQQVVYYDNGVGVGDGVLDRVTSLLGGILGEGLDYKVVRAYEFLALNYDPGDRIFIFGFSRGAYTARCLSGLIRWLGVLTRESASKAEEAMAIYRSRDPKPDNPAAQDTDAARFDAKTRLFREKYAHHSEAFTGDQEYRRGDPESLTPKGDCIWVQYVGVWDTVGSLGVPANLFLAPMLNAKYRFYDPSLSRFVRSARHAVSIDERRNTFRPTLWDNIDELNENAKATALAYSERPYQQQWFPGGHGSVGGGGADGGISIPPLLWIAEGAERAGFSLDGSKILKWSGHADPLAPIHRRKDLMERLIEMDGVADRTGIRSFDEVSLSARLRWKKKPGYRPAALQLETLTPDLNTRSLPDPLVWFTPNGRETGPRRRR